MNKAVHVLTTGCLLCAVVIGRASLTVLSTDVVEAAPSLASITGTVKDESGMPLVGAVVAVLEPRPRGKEIKSVKTDASGKFSTQITPGLYRLRVAAEGFAAKLLNININRPTRANYDLALRRTDTLVQKRGDSDDYRWVARSVPRHVLNLTEESSDLNQREADDQLAAEEGSSPRSGIQPSLFSHGTAQFLAASSTSRAGQPGSSFFGSNFALSSTLPGNVEMVLVGQRGFGQLAPQRFSAIASMRPNDKHQLTASIGYGQFMFGRRNHTDLAASDLGQAMGSTRNSAQDDQIHTALPDGISFDQVSVSAIGTWQAFQPLLIIYGFDYSRFVGSAVRQDDCMLPRFAVQYSPSPKLRLNAGLTPGSDQNRQSTENFQTENIQASFEDSPAEIAFDGYPIPDRSRRYEAGIERFFGNGSSVLEASAFYDLISGHGVGILALPLEASPENEAAFAQVANKVTAMNGTARGVRLMFKRHLNDHLSAAVGYSMGRGTRFNSEGDPLVPAEWFRSGFFQVATAKFDLDLANETGTHISTVIRLSPSAVVFAIDPFAGRMSVYDPNINVYVTQDLPNFGLPVHWQALVDIRNLLDQPGGAEDGIVKLIVARARRTVRGGLAFRW